MESLGNFFWALQESQKRRLRDDFGTPKRPNIGGKGLEFHRNAYIMSYGHCFFQDFIIIIIFFFCSGSEDRPYEDVEKVANHP
jgi:hypothetical protein